MDKTLPATYLQTLVEFGIKKLQEVPETLPTEDNPKYLRGASANFYLKYQYNLELAGDSISEEAFKTIDQTLVDMYTPASGRTLYYDFEYLDEHDEPAMFINAIFHYGFQYNTTSKQLVFDIGNNSSRVIDLQKSADNLEKPSMFTLTSVPFSKLVSDLYQSIVSSSISVNVDTLELFKGLVDYMLGSGNSLTRSDKITNRDVAMVQEVVLDVLTININSLSDLLRVVKIASSYKQGLPYNSQEPLGQLKLTTHWQKVISTTFYKYYHEVSSELAIKQELAQHTSDWKRVFMLVNKHPNGATKNLWDKFRRLIFTEHFRSPNSEIEKAVASEDLKQYDRVFHKYPSLTIRHLIDFTRKAEEAYIPSQSDLAKIPTRILLQVINRLFTLTYNSVSEDDLKLSKFKGALTLIPENAVAPSMGKVFESELRSIAQELANRSNETTKDLSTADLEQEVPKKQAYELAMNTEGLTNADDTITLPYLSKVFFGDDNLISPMIYWEDPADLDLSVIFYNKNMQEENQLSFTHYETYYAKHSGDITHATKGEPAVERALIDREKALSRGVRYALVTTTVYYGEDTTKFKTGVATYQNEAEAKDLYSASGIANLGTMQAQGSQTYLMLIDLKLGVEYVIGKPTRATVMLANTADFSSVNQALAKLVLRDSLECLHYQDLFGNAQAHQPETQLKLLNKLNEM